MRTCIFPAPSRATTVRRGTPACDAVTAYLRRARSDLLRAPSAALFEWARSAPLTAARWSQFARRYRREMQAPAADRLIRTLSALSPQADFSVGTFKLTLPLAPSTLSDS